MAASSATAAPVTDPVTEQPQSVAISGIDRASWGVPGANSQSEPGGNRFATKWFECHRQCCPSFCVSLWCPCIIFARLKARHDITAGTGTAAFWPNVLLMGALHLILWTDVWANFVGFTEHGCTFAKYFENVTFFTGDGSLDYCTTTRLGDYQDVVQMVFWICSCLVFRALRHRYRLLQQLPSRECDGLSCDDDGEDCILSCCCCYCMLAQMDRHQQQQDSGGGAESLRVCECSPAACARTCARPPTRVGPNHGVGSASASEGVNVTGGGARGSQVAPLRGEP